MVNTRAKIKLDRLLSRSRETADGYESPRFEHIDLTRPFLPEHFTQLYHTASYRQLTEAQRLRYNQLSGLRANEQFMMFEEGFTRRVVTKLNVLLRRNGEHHLSDCLDYMLLEEARHREMFRRFNRRCLGRVYGDEQAYFARLSRLEHGLLWALTIRPQELHFLAWIILLLEEFSTGFSRMLASTQWGQLGDLEHNYVYLHRLHLEDESRHVQLDQLLIEWLLARANAMLTRFNAWALRAVVKEILTPKRSGIRVIQHLVDEFPELREHEATMIQQVHRLGIDPGVAAIVEDRGSMPLTHRLLERHPEFSWFAPGERSNRQ